METTFKKNNNSVVINTNKSGLRQARRRKKLLLAKDQKIDDLECRISQLEASMNKILNNLTTG